MRTANARVIVLIVLVAAAAASLVMFMLMPGGGQTTGPVVMAPVDRLEPLYELPDFELIDQDEQSLGLADLAGRVWVADFIFTRCPTLCLQLSTNMAELQDRLDRHPGRSQVRLASISVDPEYDTPQVLREYAQRYGADLSRWSFLTGDRQEIWELVRDGFRLVVYEQPHDEMPIAHSSKFALVDQQGQVRGYYDGSTQHELDQLIADIDTLLASGR